MIELRSLTKRFAPTIAVNDVSLAIRAGEFVTLLGPSGCGKTTILRCISGFETPDSGAVLLDGQDVTHVPPYKRDVNQVFQSYALFPHLSVEENVAFGLRMKRVPRDERKHRVAEAIELVALHGLEARKPSQLSGGQMQRVALARAIVNRPKVLLLDEPLAALDAKLRRAMQIELKHLQRRLGITFVFVTHDQEEALILSDRIAVMNAGRIEQLGSAEDVYHRPASEFVASFIGQTNLLNVTVIDEGKVRTDAGFEFAFATRESIGTKLLVMIRPERIQLAAANDANSLPAEILERIFRGDTTLLLVRLSGGGQELEILQSGHFDPSTDQVRVRFDPSDVVRIQ
jgi:spermidine/putrescine transport system ATP-binding protein